MSPLFLAVPRYEAFARALASDVGGEFGVIERRDFPDGEHYQRIQSPLVHRDVIIVGGSVDDQDTLCLFDLRISGLLIFRKRQTGVQPSPSMENQSRQLRIRKVMN